MPWPSFKGKPRKDMGPMVRFKWRKEFTARMVESGNCAFNASMARPRNWRPESAPSKIAPRSSTSWFQMPAKLLRKTAQLFYYDTSSHVQCALPPPPPPPNSRSWVSLCFHGPRVFMFFIERSLYKFKRGSDAHQLVVKGRSFLTTPRRFDFKEGPGLYPQTVGVS